MNDRRVQLGCCYCSYAFIALFCLGWMVLARFLPPPSPTASAETIANQFRGNATGIRLGMIVSILASTLLLPWGGAVCVQLRRIDAGGGALVWAWSAALALLVLEFIYPCAFWCVAAFRLEDAERIQSFNDLAWLPFFSIVSTGIFQMIVLAITTLADRRAEPVFPRWFAYFQIWCAFGVAPASFVVVFKTGPFAWNGLLAYWVGLVAALAWVLVTSVMTARAIRRAPERSGGHRDDGSLADRVATLEATLAGLRDGPPRSP